MTIKVGDKLPTVSLKYMNKDGMQTATTDELFKGKKAVLFGLPPRLRGKSVGGLAVGFSYCDAKFGIWARYPVQSRCIGRPVNQKPAAAIPNLAHRRPVKSIIGSADGHAVRC